MHICNNIAKYPDKNNSSNIPTWLFSFVIQITESRIHKWWWVDSSHFLYEHLLSHFSMLVLIDHRNVLILVIVYNEATIKLLLLFNIKMLLANLHRNSYP